MIHKSFFGKVGKNLPCDENGMVGEREDLPETYPWVPYDIFIEYYFNRFRFYFGEDILTDRRIWFKNWVDECEEALSKIETKEERCNRKTTILCSCGDHLHPDKRRGSIYTYKCLGCNKEYRLKIKNLNDK